MIRPGTFADIDGIVTLGGYLFERTPYAKRFAFDEGEAKMAVARALGDRKESLVLVSERRDEVEGFVVAGTFDLPFSSTRYVSDLALCARDGSGGFLLRRMVKWARCRGMPVMVSSGASAGRNDPMYYAAGLQPAGQLFVG